MTVMRTASVTHHTLYSEYSFPGTNFRVYQSLYSCGTMGRTLNSGAHSRFYEMTGVDRECVRTMVQVHSQNIISSGDWYPGIEGDGYITDCSGEVAGVTTADCVPVYIFHREIPYFGVFHSGWKGTGIVVKGIDALVALSGESPSCFSAFLGPSIGPCCYRVDKKRADTFQELYGDNAVIRNSEGLSIDLRAVNSGLLENAGVRKIYADTVCTCCNTAYGSFRRQGSDEYTLMLSLGRYTRR